SHEEVAMGNNLHRRATRARAVLEVLATMLIILTSSVALYLLVSGEISRRAAAEASRSATPAPPTPPPVSPPLPIPADPIPLATAATKGAANAPVAIIEFSDFQCPFCARF